MQKSKYSKRWHRRKMLFNQSVPDDIAPWLFDSSSLTKRLMQHCHENFRVEVITQSVARAALDERRALGVAAGRYALVREVLLYCDGLAVVYARTVIPLKTLMGAQRSYASLGNRPLGAMLFTDRSMSRDEVEIAMLDLNDPLYINTQCQDEAVWGRRSIFRVGGKPLLVSEYFLPAIYQ